MKLWQVVNFPLISICGYQVFQLRSLLHPLVVSCLSYQVHTLLKGLEKIAASADIPMLVCGDFNSVPGRFVYFPHLVSPGVQNLLSSLA